MLFFSNFVGYVVDHKRVSKQNEKEVTGINDPLNSFNIGVWLD